MEIYIETFLIQNILINFCLLKLVYLTTKTKTSTFKLIFSSLLGAIPSVLMAIVIQNNIVLNIAKIATASLMLIISFKQTKKQFVFNFLLLFLFTYAFGGIITSLSSQVYFTSFGAVITSKFSLELICIIFIVFTYIYEHLVKHLKLKINTNNLIYNLKLSHKNNSISINAYMDTGNFINHNGEPVLILDLDAYLKLTQTNLISFLSSNLETIPTSTINGNNKLKLFKIDKIEIKNKNKNIEINNCYVAINQNNCFKNTNYQALLSPLFL